MTNILIIHLLQAHFFFEAAPLLTNLKYVVLLWYVIGAILEHRKMLLCSHTNRVIF